MSHSARLLKKVELISGRAVPPHGAGKSEMLPNPNTNNATGGDVKVWNSSLGRGCLRIIFG